MRESPLATRNERGEILLDAQRCCGKREPKAMRNTKNVRIDGECGFLERNRHHDRRGFSSDACQGFELLALARYFAAVVLDQVARRADDVLGLHPKEAA